jgi:hypothetical protein
MPVAGALCPSAGVGSVIVHPFMTRITADFTFAGGFRPISVGWRWWKDSAWREPQLAHMWLIAAEPWLTCDQSLPNSGSRVTNLYRTLARV